MKDNYLDKAISWARKKGMISLRANHDDYEQPSSFMKKGEEKPYVPDITGNQTGKKNYVEIALKSKNVRRMISKWKLMATMARMKGGKLFLLAPKGHKTFTDKMVKKYNLDAQVIYLR